MGDITIRPVRRPPQLKTVLAENAGALRHIRRRTNVTFASDTVEPSSLDPPGIRRNMDKVAGLKDILGQDPKNAFARYGLAMEYAGRGETEAALAEFGQLLADHPDYTAGYFMAAQTLAKVSRQAEAKQKLVDGLACARRLGNQHAASEMQAMLDEIELPE